MLNIPESVKALFKADGVRKNFRVHFPNGELPDITNDNVVQESVRFTESLCSQDVLKFGLTEASVLEFETVGVANMYGMTIEAGIEIDLSSLSAADIEDISAGSWDGVYVSESETDIGFPFFRVPYGVFRVESCPRDHQAMTHRKVQAYTMTPKDGPWFPKLLRILPFQTAAISSEAFLAALYDSAELHDTVTYTSNNFNSADLYDSAGNAISPSIYLVKNGTTIQSRFVRFYRPYSISDVTTQRWTPSFIKVSDVGYNLNAYYRFGQRVAKALTDAGLDLTYNASMKKVYANNEAALLDKFPYYFFPCMYYAYDYKDNYYTATTAAEAIRPGELVPILSTRNSSTFPGMKNYPAAFRVDESDLLLNAGYVVACANISGETDFQFKVSLSTISANIPEFSFDYTFPDEYPTIERYGLPDYGQMLEFQSMTEAPKITLFGTPQTRHKTWDFTGAAPYLDMINSILEAKAQFLKNLRFGGTAIMRLDDSSPLTILPGLYSEMWWDEFDVDDIGQVIISFLDEEGKESTGVVYISGGGSIYNMTGNVFYKALPDETLSSISSLINTQFTPYTGTVNYTPIDLTAKGQPWIEAGDALAVVTEDSLIVESYALRMEISGIQILEMIITSEGGQIIDSEEAQT